MNECAERGSRAKLKKQRQMEELTRKLRQNSVAMLAMAHQCRPENREEFVGRLSWQAVEFQPANQLFLLHKVELRCRNVPLGHFKFGFLNCWPLHSAHQFVISDDRY